MSTRDIKAGGNIVFAHNTITGVSAGASTQEGALQLTNTSTCESSTGITVEYNTFSYGIGDFIQTAGNVCRAVIRYNQFINKDDPTNCTGYTSGCPHSDGIQGVSDSTGIVITGNYFKNQVDCILTADGSYANMTFTDNVCVVTTAVRPIQGAGWTGTSLVEHNTVVSPSDGSSWDATHDGVNTSGMTGRNNIFTQGIGNGIQAGGQWSVFDYNFSDCTSGNPCGTHNIDPAGGAVTFTGGSNPSTWIGYKLATGSRGKNAASDGTDMGATFATTPGA